VNAVGSEGIQMSSRKLKLEAIKDISLEEVILRVLRENQGLTIQVSEEQEVVIQPQQKLRPLPVLDGRIPEGWEDAVYGRESRHCVRRP
jgi:hypothetical protein